MENASKALIIAGAILLSILIIGLGMYIYNEAASAMSETGLDEQTLKAYNDQFERYEGTTVKGATVKAMIDTVRNHNNANLNDFSKMVQLTNANAATNPSANSFTADPNAGNYATLKADIKNGAQYTVQCGHDPQTGFVTEIAYIINQ